MDGGGISEGCEGIGGDGSRISGRGGRGAIGKRSAGAACEADADYWDGVFGSFRFDWVLGGVAARASHKEADPSGMNEVSLPFSLCWQFRSMRTQGRRGDDRLLIWRVFLGRLGEWLGFVEIGNYGSRAREWEADRGFLRRKCA